MYRRGKDHAYNLKTKLSFQISQEEYNIINMKFDHEQLHRLKGRKF